MILRSGKQLSTKILIMYLISALLFLTSISLHIHTQEAAVSAEHGSAVSISGLSSEFLPSGSNNEIKVSPDGVLKVSQNSVNLLVVFLLVSLIALFVCQSCVSRFRESNVQLPAILFHGTPPLRAPPL